MTAPSFVIHGHLEQEQGDAYAVCENVPISVSGADDRAVLDGMIRAVSVYLSELTDDEWVSLTTAANKRRAAAPSLRQDGTRFDVLV